MTNKYTALIPAYHCQFPNYFATVNAVTEAFVRQQDSTRGIVPAFDLDSAIGAQLDVIGLWVRRGRRIRAPAVNHYFRSMIRSGFRHGDMEGTLRLRRRVYRYG